MLYCTYDQYTAAGGMVPETAFGVLCSRASRMIDSATFGRAESHAARPRNETVEQICAYLAANYQQKFSLSEVAAKFYISPYYLSRLFRRVTGQSIVDYINGRRIEAAQRLLESTDLNISAVAEQTGFASAAHFRRVFRETMGTGPLQYRKSHRG